MKSGKWLYKTPDGVWLDHPGPRVAKVKARPSAWECATTWLMGIDGWLTLYGGLKGNRTNLDKFTELASTLQTLQGYLDGRLPLPRRTTIKDPTAGKSRRECELSVSTWERIPYWIEQIGQWPHFTEGQRETLRKNVEALIRHVAQVIEIANSEK